jgi:50S ribosomal subunit-associated GTPase HflX
MRWNRRNYHGFILVYSITSRRSFEWVETSYQHLVRLKGEATKVILVGNKADNLNKREVSSEEGYALARQYGCRFFETSAKTRVNVEEAFISLVRILRDSVATNPEMPTGMATRATIRGKGERKCAARWAARLFLPSSFALTSGHLSGHAPRRIPLHVILHVTAR